ncbi:MAG: hypothetical protein HOP21_00060 [Methylotenera sp.]|nr:hypothetical protein [Methylotenera sp.]
MINTQKLAYTVFLEPAICDWAWVKNAEDETMYVGRCVTAGEYWGGHVPISELLTEMVSDWLNPFRQGMPDSFFDWNAFNAQGIAIAKQLKLELGDDVDVRYVKPTEDPSYIFEEGFAILNDGSVVQMTRKPNIHSSNQ